MSEETRSTNQTDVRQDDQDEARMRDEGCPNGVDKRPKEAAPSEEEK